MSRLSSPRPDILVIGAGALGLAAAARAARDGARVWVLESATTNASSVAAGMIAPGFEAALEDATPERAALYRRAAALWPGFAADLGIVLDADGADWIGPAEPLRSRLTALGFAAEAAADGLHVPGEALVDPPKALRALRRGVEAAGGAIVAGCALSLAGRTVETRDGPIEAGAVVVATGWSAQGLSAPGLEPVLAAVSPIKGQIVRLGGRGPGRPVRGPGVYLVPRGDETLAGATMESGVADTCIDEVRIEALRQAALAIWPALAGAPVTGASAGVRGATADGLPMAGATCVPGVFAALAPRRNGWLLAPLVAGIVTAAIREGTPGEDGQILRPERFMSVSSA